MSHKVGDFVWDNSGFLGEGSFGKVYKGKNQKTGEIVAVKCMDMKSFNDPYMAESLKKEIAVMKQLTSPNVVRMFDVQGDKDTTYIILEFCPDGDLDKFIRKNGGLLKEDIAIKVMQQLMVGFQNLVNLGYIHRDIKPANCLVKQDVFKVADFGFATKADISGIKRIRECVGTPLYMAPQLLESQPYGAKSDIWSIGMMFYEMLFGKTPWPCRDINSFLLNIKTSPLKFPYNAQIGCETKDFIQKCLVVSENQRVGWNEIFNHKMLKDPGKKIEPTINLDQKAQTILRKMQEIVQAHNLDIQQIFNNFDKEKSGFLDQQEFYKMMQIIDPRTTFSEAQHIFTSVDTSKDGKISREEFKQIFCNYDFSDLSDKAQQIIVDLKEIVKANKYNLKQIFQKLDQDKGGSLDRKEFEKFIKIVAPKIRDYEIDAVFKKFDSNGDGTISYEEFYRTMAYGIDGQDSKFNPEQEKAMKIIGELKRIIQKHNLNLQQIFNNFDKSKDGKLDFAEFKKMVLVIDKTVPDNEVQLIYKMFDNKGDGSIEFTEFAKQLK